MANQVEFGGPVGQEEGSVRSEFDTAPYIPQYGFDFDKDTPGVPAGNHVFGSDAGAKD